MSQEAGIASSNGKKIAFKSVHIEGQVDGVLANMEVTQRYHNDSGITLEIVYTFPLAWGATLLGMEVALGNKRLRAVVLQKTDASEQYEEALECGDSPILVEHSGPGLYSANLGNIENGESVTVHLRYAQLLDGDLGKLRLRIPCTVAPRYGNPSASSGLALHQSTAVDTLAEYPLTLRVALLGQLAGAAPSCPSHLCTVEPCAGGKAVVIQSGAMLDRDVILHLGCEAPLSQVMTGPDMTGTESSGRFLQLAAFCPSLPQHRHKPLCLKILADCSGSMAGDSIVLVMEALDEILLQLHSEDHVSYSRFGSTVCHETSGLLPCKTLGEATKVALAFRSTAADMGGTEMEQALVSVCTDIPVPQGVEATPCLLLITDGAVWNVENMVSTAKACGHRVFAIGVGSAPAESLLRELALETGGACAFVSFNESIQETVTSMLGKMRGPTAKGLRVDWGAAPLWQSSLPIHAYAGERVYTFASFAKPPAQAPILHWCVGGEACQLQAEAAPLPWNDALPRLAGAVRMAEAATQEEVLALALTYQLVSKYSSLLLVHEREGKKGDGFPTLHQVPHMMAAGHGGFGSARHSPATHHSLCLSEAPPRPQPSSLRVYPEGDILDVTFPSYVRKRPVPGSRAKQKGRGVGPAYMRLQNRDIWLAPYMLPVPHDIDSLLYLAGKTAETTASREQTLHTFIAFAKRSDFPRLIGRLCAEKALAEEQVWALLLHWLIANYAGVQERSVLRLFGEKVPGVADVTNNEVLRYFDQCFLLADDEVWESM